MRYNRFFVPAGVLLGRVAKIIDPAVCKQISKVLRLREGEEIILLDGDGFEYVSRLVKVSAREAQAEILNRRANKNEPELKVTVYQALPKKDKFEWVAEKATELGVSHIVPLTAERSEKKGYNAERLRKIIIESAEQSGRATVPAIHEAVTVTEALKEHKFSLFACDPRGVSRYQLPSASSTFGLFVGPEGGWSDKELELFKNRGAELISLGGTTLRAETAAIAATTLALFL